MNDSKMWLAVLLSVVFISGCGSNGSNNNSAPDATIPTVSSTKPDDTATGVAINRKITATFSEAMDAATMTPVTFTLLDGATPVSGAVTYGGGVAVFTPAANLASNTAFTATVTTGAKDPTGNALAANKTWSFTTGAAADNTAPTVSSTDPADVATGVAINRPITANFSEEMDPTTIVGANFTVAGPAATSVAGTVTFNETSRLATFTPSSNLAASAIFTATIGTGAKDLSGNAMAANKTWSFTTGSVAAAGPARVNLGTAGDYVILAKSAVSTTGATAVVGDIGLSPAAGTLVTGFAETLDGTGTFSTSPQVTGKIYAANYTSPTPSNLTTAILDMQTAYTDAAGRVLPDFTELGAGNIDGMTLVPGLYKWGTGVTIPIGVTLAGAANDVWIFQVGQDLNVGNGAIVTLNGAQAKNIFWQVAGQATLGTTSDFKGVILSQTLISLNTGAIMNGRALAQTAVTLNATAISEP
jgi:hypothetical protein